MLCVHRYSSSVLINSLNCLCAQILCCYAGRHYCDLHLSSAGPCSITACFSVVGEDDSDMQSNANPWNTCQYRCFTMRHASTVAAAHVHQRTPKNTEKVNIDCLQTNLSALPINTMNVFGPCGVCKE